ncbi:MAG: YgdI/YgdR family lipoprotein, partial [Oscillospiraceae bacterium]|nr:YgdI/YgdR family lipoprotein [Oscillospiraceae bacterium]
MVKKIFAAVVSAVMLICMAGCSGKYVMTEEDIAVQKSIEGYWLADDSTGYNEYDENGYFTALTAVEFTSDYKYLLHICMPGDGQADGYVMTYDPVAYSFEDKMFRVDVDGIASYARVSVSEDGQTLFWITDDQTDRYNRLTAEQAAAMGIPEYDPAAYEETEANSEAGDITGNETGMVSENAEEGAPVVNSNLDLSEDIDVSNFNFDRSVTLASENVEIDKTPVLLWESEDGEFAVYGIYLYGKEPYIFIEHDGVIDTFEQAWNTPRRILPIAAYADYDGDGEKELAVSYYVGSGTGVSIEELVIYEKDSDGHFTEHRFEAPEDILNEKLTVEIDEENTSVNFTFDGKSITKNYGEGFEYIKNILSKQEEAEFRFGDII